MPVRLSPMYSPLIYILTLYVRTDCEEIMTALDECHARGFLYKALGNCNDVKREVNRCLGAERYVRAKRNRDQARENRKKMERIWAEERVFEGRVKPEDVAGKQ